MKRRTFVKTSVKVVALLAISYYFSPFAWKGFLAAQILSEYWASQRSKKIKVLSWR